MNAKPKKYEHVRIFPSVRFYPQIYPTASGERWITYLVVVNGVHVGYSRCMCRAQKAAELLQVTIR